MYGFQIKSFQELNLLNLDASLLQAHIAVVFPKFHFI